MGKKTIRRRLILFLAWLPAAGLGAQDRLLRMDVRNRPPELQVARNGTCTGPLIEVMETAAASLGYRMQYQTRQFEGSLKALELGWADLVPRVGWTEERARRIAFIGPIGYERKEIRFLVRKGKEALVRTYQDLYGVKIGTKKGSLYFDRFDRDSGLDKVQSLDDDNLVQMFSAGRFDVLATVDREALEAALLKYGVRDYAYARYHCTNVFAVFYGTKPGHPIKEPLDRALRAMVASGEVTRIYQKYGVPPLCARKP